MLKKMLATIKENELIAVGDTVLVALSGGPDSVALLEGLLRLKERLSSSICAAHLNHKLRGADSDEDERFVRSLAKKRGVPLVVEARDVQRIHKKRGGSIEAVAREVRYRFLKKAAKKCGANKIALGHNMDDNAETFLMNLIRGSGLKGLSGMPISRKEGDSLVIRPVLGVTRGEILWFLEKEKLPYRQDLSNLDTSLTRNRIRQQLIPILARDYNPQIAKVLAETARNLQEAEQCLSAALAEMEKESLRAGRGEVSVDTSRLAAHAPALAREFLRRVLLERLGVAVEPRTLEELWRLAAGTRTESLGLGSGLVACREYDRITFVPESGLAARPFEKKLRTPCDILIPELGIEVSARFEAATAADRRFGRTVSHAREKVGSLRPRGKPGGARTDFGEVWRRVKLGEAQSFEEFFDASAMGRSGILVRTRRPGDTFRPLGMKGTRKVKELLIDEKVPATVRERIPIFCCRGRIMWVMGHRPAAEFAVRKSSKKVLRVAVKVLYCPEQRASI